MPELTMRFEPRTVEHLGSQMYSHLPNALAELVANSYDADATSVLISITGTGTAQTVQVVDNGHGMSLDDLQEKYLAIGRNRRDIGGKSESGKRSVSGKKGIGKLALFGIGRTVTVSTGRRNSKQAQTMTLDYDMMLAVEGGEYRPSVSFADKDLGDSGTTITIGRLSRKTRIEPRAVAQGLAKLFNLFDKKFEITVANEQERVTVTQSLRLDSVNIEFSWVIEDLPSPVGDYFRDRKVTGTIVASAKPLRHAMRGVSLYAKGRLINEPEFYGVSESSFAFSYITGYLDVDYLDDIRPDVISTDRRGISWDTEETQMLYSQLETLLRYLSLQWRERRAEKATERAENRTAKDFSRWTSRVRGTEGTALRKILTLTTSPEADIPDDVQDQLIGGLQEIVPEYPDLLWRHLHPEIRDAAAADYKEARYFHAVEEAIKRYITAVSNQSHFHDTSARTVVEAAFGKNGKLSVFNKYVSVVTNGISQDTGDNIEEGQKFLSTGIVTGVRNPFAHQEKQKLEDSGAFTSGDCLDALSLLSYLHRRLDDAQLK